ncbi:hypothetical protein GCM10023091_37060 [Ravibacter arvi]|uniref:histidine kinase n=2 Tax=Ravibacter arvi TaxID=2051041 RepID=A0ABP8M9S1_9BACT
MAEAYYLFGKVHVAARNYLTGKRYFMKSLGIVEQRQQFDKVSRIYTRLSRLEKEQSDPHKALEYARLALVYAHRSNQKTLMAAYQCMSRFYLDVCHDALTDNQKNPCQDSLFFYCRQTESIAYKLRDSITIADISGILGKAYGLQRNPKAFRYYQVALQIDKALNHINSEAVTCLQLGLTHLQFNQPDSAYSWLKQASELYHSLKSQEFSLERDLANAYLQYYQQKKDWHKAFDQSMIVRGYERDQMTADRNGAVSRLSVEYETQKKEAQLINQRNELQLSQQNQQAQRWLLVILSVLLLGTTGASVAFYKISQKNHRLSQQNAALVQEQNHRVKNNLQLVSSLLSLQSNRLDDECARNAVGDSQRRIEVMSLLQRKLYDGDNLVAVNVAEFMKELVTMVIKAFEQEEVEVAYQIDQAMMLPADYAMRIGLIANELVTNACKYAFSDHPNPALRIEASLTGRTFQLRVVDNGPGFIETQTPARSFGLRLIQIQVEQLFGTYRFESNGNLQFEMTFNLIPPSSLRKKLKQPWPDEIA